MTHKNDIEQASLLVNWLDKPYHQNSNSLYKVGISFGMGVIIYAFIVLIKPLPLERITTNLELFAINSAVLITLIFLLYHFILKKIFRPFFDPAYWTFGKHLISFFGIILVTSFINWNTNPCLKKGEEPIKIDNYAGFLGIALGVGCIPMSLYLIIDERYARYEKKKKHTVKKGLQNAKTPEKNSDIITLYAYNNKDYIKFEIDDVVYITSESNYASVFIVENGKIKERVVRNTLKKIDESLSEFNNIVRCHKSYIINKNYILKKVAGGQSVLLNMNNEVKEIPLSKNYSTIEVEG